MTCNVFAVIPARGGSKRIPEKNLRTVAGKPLIAHTIQQAAAAETIDRAVVSTDDDEIAETARKYNGEVPFRRPATLATDEARSAPVVEHALNWVEDQGATPSVIVMLQVTTPLRRPEDINGAINVLRQHDDASSVVSVTEFGTPPYWAVETDEDGYLRNHFDPDALWTNELPRSQDLPALRHPNGAVFAARSGAFRAAESFYTDSTIPYEMPRDRSIDIDEPIDLEIIRALAD